MTEQTGIGIIEKMRQVGRDLHPNPKDAVSATAQKFFERGGFTPTNQELMRVQFAHLDIGNQRDTLSDGVETESKRAQLTHQLNQLRSYASFLKKEPDFTERGENVFGDISQIKGYLTGYESISDASLASLLHQTHPPQGFETWLNSQPQ